MTSNNQANLNRIIHRNLRCPDELPVTSIRGAKSTQFIAVPLQSHPVGGPLGIGGRHGRRTPRRVPAMKVYSPSSAHVNKGIALIGIIGFTNHDPNLDPHMDVIEPNFTDEAFNFGSDGHIPSDFLPGETHAIAIAPDIITRSGHCP